MEFYIFIRKRSGEWEDHLENISKKRGKTLREVKKLAKDRENFRRWIDPTLKGKRER